MLCHRAEASGNCGAGQGKALTQGAICRLVDINNHIHLGEVDEPAQEVPPQSQHSAVTLAGARGGHTVKYGHTAEGL